MLKNYSCGICKTNPDQISHHKSHLDTQKHKDKKELFELKLTKLNNKELEEKYKTTNIYEIVTELETMLYNKKLNKSETDHVEIKMANTKFAQPDISEMEMSEYTSISNKDALKSKIHEIHNYLRNHGAGYGMNALKVFNILYGLKKIEENGLIDKVGLKKPYCEFSYLLQLANEEKDEKLAELIFGDVLQSISESELRDILFYEIPQNIKGSVFTYIIKEINKITLIEKSCNVLLSGKIYEYFIGRDETAISELGAYFTDRHIVDFILNKLNPCLNDDGTVPTMIDMFGGSGGFTTGYIHYMNQFDIDWTTEINKISHFDMNEDVIKSAGLEFFCLTGVLPNMENLKYKNSFTDEFNDKKYKYPLTNPPYGGDKSKKSDAQEKRDKIKKYIKTELSSTSDECVKIRRQTQLKKIEIEEKQEKKGSDKSKVSLPTCSARIQKFAKDHELKGNDKESCSLILLMDMVEVGGTAIGVLKEGVFFDPTYKDIRKCLIENYNVREVISVPQDQFENTKTKTSIVIFDNIGETTEVRFSDLVVERYQEDKFIEINGDIIIVENKDDIKCVIDCIVSSATKVELMTNDIYSLNGKRYNKKEIIVGQGYELVKLGDICKFIPNKFKRPATHKKKNGKYNFYSSGNEILKCDTKDFNELCVIIGHSGNGSLFIDNDFSVLGTSHILYNENVTKMYYINYILVSVWDIFYNNCYNGSTIKNTNEKSIGDFSIPIPKSKLKIQEWVDKISAPYNEKKTKQREIKVLEEMIQIRIKEIGENEHCDEVELGSICEINPETLKNKQFDYINYIDIGSVKDEIINNIQHIKENFPSRAKRIIKKNDILFSTVRPNLKGYTLINDNIVHGVVSSGFAVIRSLNIHPYYIYTLLRNDTITEYLMANTTGSNYPVVNSSAFEKIKIKIPKNKKLIQELETTFQQIETLQNEVKFADELYRQMIQELSEEAIPIKPNSNESGSSEETTTKTKTKPKKSFQTENEL